MSNRTMNSDHNKRGMRSGNWSTVLRRGGVHEGGSNRGTHGTLPDAHGRPLTPSPSSSPSLNQSRAALEALFAPKIAPPVESEPAKPPPKIVTLPLAKEVDPRHSEANRLLTKLLAAEGRATISKCADAYVNAGFSFPFEQDVMLKLLEHSDEDRIREALATLTELLDNELPKRRAVLEARLRRLEDDAEDPQTRELASSLVLLIRRKLKTHAP